MKIDLKNLPRASFDLIEPMLAKPVNQLPEEGDWFYEVKLDGYRALAVKTHGRLTLFSRRGNSLENDFR